MPTAGPVTTASLEGSGAHVSVGWGATGGASATRAGAFGASLRDGCSSGAGAAGSTGSGCVTGAGAGDVTGDGAGAMGGDVVGAGEGSSVAPTQTPMSGIPITHLGAVATGPVISDNAAINGSVVAER